MKKSLIRRTLAIVMMLFLFVGTISSIALASDEAKEETTAETVEVAPVNVEEETLPAETPVQVQEETTVANKAEEPTTVRETAEKPSVAPAEKPTEAVSEAPTKENVEEKQTEAATEAATEASTETATEAKEEVRDPAFYAQQVVDGVVITVSAAEGTFPEGSTLFTSKLPVSEQQKVDNALEQVRDDKENVAASYTFDIKVLDKDGKEVQPANMASVKVTFRLATVKDNNLDTQIYHIEDEANITKNDVQEMSVVTNGDIASI